MPPSKPPWGGGVKDESKISSNEVLDFPDDVWLFGYWCNEKYFVDVADIIRKELTLKYPLSESARRWREKIQAAECPVSLHVRHGDFAYSPEHAPRLNEFQNLPIDYHYKCLNLLRQQHPNVTAFLFSDNLNWCKENIRTGVPTEFVDGCETDVEDLYLMSLCKHNIRTASTFSWWGAWLNQNPDKKVFMPIRAEESQPVAPKEVDSPLDSDRWLRVPFTFDSRPPITMRPYFSLLLVVDDDIATLGETLGSIMGQDYKYYEVIIVDNNSTDGSGKLCRQVAMTHDKVTLVKLHEKVTLGAAWNRALDLAQGEAVLFLRGNDRLLANALSIMYLSNEYYLADVVNSTVRLRERDGGNVNIGGKKFVMETEAAFAGLKGMFRAKFDKPTLFRVWAADGNSVPLGTKIFRRNFLVDKRIRFAEQSNDAEFLFMITAMFQANENLFVPNVFYIAPK